MSHSLRRRLGALVSTVSSLALLLTFAQGSAAAQTAAPTRIKPFSHVFFIIMENFSYSSILDDPATPYITKLAHTYGLATNYFGVTHTSLPNYIALTSGNNWFSHSDSNGQVFNHKNIVDQFEAHGVSFKAYMSAMPSVGFTGDYYPPGGSALYVRKHDPFQFYPDITSNPARMRHIVPLTQLATDLKSAATTPRFAWITPDICQDMHGMSSGPCPYSKPEVLKADGNAFLSKIVPEIMHSPAWTGNSVIFITWDESDYTGNDATGGWGSVKGCCDAPRVPSGYHLYPHGGTYGGGRVPMIVIARHGVRDYVSSMPYNHYSLLRTWEEGLGLGLLGNATDSVQVHSLREFLTPKPGVANIRTVKANPSAYIGKTVDLSTAVVTVADGSTGFIQQGNSGLRYYLAGKAKTTLVPGDVVRIAGKITRYQGDLEVDPTTPPQVVAVGPTMTAYAIKTGQVGPSYDERLVSATGKVTKVSGSLVTVNDGSGPAVAYVRPSVGTAPVGSVVTIEGPVQNYKGAWQIDATRISGKGVTVSTASLTGTTTVAKIDADKTAAIGSTVTLTKLVVTAVFGGDDAFVVQNGANFRVYMAKGVRVPLKPGDVIDVTGKIAEYSGDVEIDPSTAPKVVGTTTPPAPAHIKTGDYSAAAYDEGYVTATGVASKVFTGKSGTFVLNDGSGPATCYDPSGGPKAPVSGSKVKVIGVVNKYQGQPQLEVLQILPQ